MSTNLQLPNYCQLPDLFAINLDDFGAISLTGEEKSSYLQGQVTCDVNSLTPEKLLTGAHCNAKGKVLSVFRLCQHQEKLLLLQPKNALSSSLSALQKFGVFAKVEIKQDNDITCFVVAGAQANKTLLSLYDNIPDSLTPVVTNNHHTIIYIAGAIDRYLIISDEPHITALSEKINCPIYPAPVWKLLEITEGFPTLSEAHMEEYVPQMLNLQAIHGISFTKGCYLGQETVARMQYLGKNKRALYALSVHDDKANIGDIVEKQLQENWRKAGDVIATYQASNGDSYIQAVLANDVTETSELRIKNHENKVNLLTLPYSITTD